jgi:methylated-DNA-[protein]-cysteine S-methyltransferase
VTVADGALIGVELPSGAGGWRPAAASSAPAAETSAADRQALTRWAAELEAYFRGERSGWSAEELDLDRLGLGTFELRVYEELLRVPAGETISYGELAEAAGYPRAARAVGNAMASNPIPLVIPCHRVIRADGSMGNYGCDPTWKERLLKHERVS